MASPTPPLPRKILIFGATGVIGKYIIQGLYDARESFEKLGLFTSPETAENKKAEIDGWRERGVEVVVGDVGEEEGLSRVFEGYDTVISALGRTAILAQLPLLRAASTTPTIHTFYPSEYGTDIEFSPLTSPHEPPHQLKLQVRRYIREHIRNLHITYLVTGPYSDMYFAHSQDEKCGSWDPARGRATLLGDGEGRVAFTTMRDTGKLLVKALRTPFATYPATNPHPHERILKVRSFVTTPNAALKEFERQTGRKWEVGYTGLEELREREKEAWKEDWPNKTGYTLRRIWTEGGTLYEEGWDNRVLAGGEEGLEGLEEQAGVLIQRAKSSAGS